MSPRGRGAAAGAEEKVMRKREKKIEARAIIVGLLVYLSGVLLVVLTGVLLSAWAAYDASRGGATQDEIVERAARALATNGFSLASALAGATFTFFGGYTAARRATRLKLIHALPVGLLSLFASILFVSLGVAPFHFWILPVVLLLPVPLALLGGYAAKLGWTPVATDAAEGEADIDEELKRLQNHVADQWMVKKLKRDQETARTVSQLVQQRREGEQERQQRTLEEERRYALDEAMRQSRLDACEEMREIVRQAFMNHPAATEEDFERCWPGIRDEMFVQHALRVYGTSRTQAEEELEEFRVSERGH